MNVNYLHFLSDFDPFAFLFVLGVDGLLFLSYEFGLWKRNEREER